MYDLTRKAADEIRSLSFITPETLQKRTPQQAQRARELAEREAQ